MLVWQVLPVTTGPSLLEAHAAALLSIRQVSPWGDLKWTAGRRQRFNLKTILNAWVSTKQHANNSFCCTLSSPVFVSGQVLTKIPAPEATKEPVRPLPSSASSTSSRTSMEDGGSESGSPASLSTKQLVYIAADIQKLQEQVRTHTRAPERHKTFPLVAPVLLTFSWRCLFMWSFTLTHTGLWYRCNQCKKLVRSPTHKLLYQWQTILYCYI